MLFFAIFFHDQAYCAPSNDVVVALIVFCFQAIFFLQNTLMMYSSRSVIWQIG